MDALPSHHESQPKAAVVSYASNNFQRDKFEAAGIDTSFFDDAKERLRTCENIEQCYGVMFEIFETLCNHQPEKFGDAYALTFGSLKLLSENIPLEYESKMGRVMKMATQKVIDQKLWEDETNHEIYKQITQLYDSYYGELDTVVADFLDAASASGAKGTAFRTLVILKTRANRL